MLTTEGKLEMSGSLFGRRLKNLAGKMGLTQIKCEFDRWVPSSKQNAVLETGLEKDYIGARASPRLRDVTE